MGQFPDYYMSRTKNGRVGVSWPYLKSNGGLVGLTKEEIKLLENIGSISNDIDKYDIWVVSGWHGCVVTLMEGGMVINLCGIPTMGKEKILADGIIAEASKNLEQRYIFWSGPNRPENFVQKKIQGFTSAVCIEGPMMYSLYFFPPQNLKKIDNLKLGISIENHDPVNPPIPGVRISPGKPDLMGYEQDMFDSYFSHIPYFMGVATDVECEVASSIFMPHRWYTKNIAEKVKIFRWNEEDIEGPTIVTYSDSKSKNKRQRNIQSFWDRIEVIEGDNWSEEFYYSPITGWLHLKNSFMGFIHGLGNYSWEHGLFLETNPSFCEWHYLMDPDIYRNCLQSFLCYFDLDNDGYFDTYLFDENNDGYYEKCIFYNPKEGLIKINKGDLTTTLWKKIDLKRKEKGLIFEELNINEKEFVKNQKVAAIDIYHSDDDKKGTWGDFLHTGYSSLGTQRSCHGYVLKLINEPINDKTLHNVQILIVNRIGGNNYSLTEIEYIQNFVKRGGILVIVASSECRRFFYEYHLLTLPFDIVISPEKETNYQEISPYQFNYFSENNFEKDFIDMSNRGLLKGINRIMLCSHILELSDNAKPILLFKEKPVVAYAEYGKGRVFVFGSPDFLSNRVISEGLNYPLDLTTVSYPCLPGNKLIRDRLIQWFIEKKEKQNGQELLSISNRIKLLKKIINKEFEKISESIPNRGLRFISPSFPYTSIGMWTNKKCYAPGEKVKLIIAISSHLEEKRKVIVKVFNSKKEKIDELSQEIEVKRDKISKLVLNWTIPEDNVDSEYLFWKHMIKVVFLSLLIIDMILNFCLRDNW